MRIIITTVMDVAQAESIWLALIDMINDLDHKGISISGDMMNSISDCKRLVNHFKSAKDCNGSGVKFACVLEELRRLEDLLVMQAFQNLGEDYAKEWESRLSRIWFSDTSSTPGYGQRRIVRKSLRKRAIRALGG